MAQHDYVIANGTGAAVRSDLNNALAAIVSQNSGATAPATTYAYQFWADTTTNLLKLRNSANSAWITLFQLDGEWSTLPVENGTAAAPSIYFKDSGTDTGFYSPGTDQVGISTAGTARLTIDANGNLAVDTNTLYVDAPNNRVGIGTSSPSSLLHVSGGDILLSNAYSLLARNNANTLSLALIRRDASDNVVIDPDQYGTKIGGTTLVTTSAGRVGIGTATPGSALDVSLANNTYIYARENGTNQTAGYQVVANGGTPTAVFSSNTATGEVRLGGIATNYFQTFYTNNTEKARLDSSGRWLLGTSSTTGIDAIFQAVGSASVFHRTANDEFPSIVYLSKARGTGAQTVNNGDNIGNVSFVGYDGTNPIRAAEIGAYVDATPGTNDMPGRLVFSTTADGASSPTESFRITNAGRAIFNRLGTPTDFDFVAQVFADSTVGGVAVQTNQTGARTAIRFRNPNGIIGEIITNGSATAYNTSSDYRLKENVAAVADGIIRLQQLKPSRFNFKANPTNTVDGFIAHEVQAVVPEAVTGEKDAVDDDGNPIYQGIDQSKLVPLLTAALQEAIGEIESLKARVAALEGA